MVCLIKIMGIVEYGTNDKFTSIMTFYLSLNISYYLFIERFSIRDP